MFQTRFGAITIERTRGYCKRCRKWRRPADVALGLEETAGYSPAVQEMAALLASKMPVEEASVVLEHLTGIKLPRATLIASIISGCVSPKSPPHRIAEVGSEDIFS